MPPSSSDRRPSVGQPRACSKSAITSPMSSSPTLTRRRPSLTPAVDLFARGEAGVCRGHRVTDQRLGATERCGATNQLEPVEKVAGRAPASAQLERQHRARTGASGVSPTRAGDACRGRDSARRRPHGASSSHSASRCADADWCSVRTANVRMPRRAFSESNGDAMAPCRTAYDQMASTSSRSPAITPRVASLCPAMPLVAECRTRSTPCDSGCCPIGVANVESTRVKGPLIAPISSRSHSSSRGFDGDSAITIVVPAGSHRTPRRRRAACRRRS